MDAAQHAAQVVDGWMEDCAIALAPEHRRRLVEDVMGAFIERTPRFREPSAPEANEGEPA